MKLTFSVLWFDDTEDFFGSLQIDWLEKEIEGWGFSPDIKLVTTPEQFWSFSPYQKIDLIVVDRNLEDYGEGQNFIASLRSHAVYTEVIFYTAGNASILWDAIREKELEGVFVSNRGNILQKISKVGYQSIRKVLDLENMRGIVMAEVGELDHLLDEIITTGFRELQEQHQKTIFNRFYKDIAKTNEEYGKSLVAFYETPSLEQLLNLCDSNKRWDNFIRLGKYHDKLKDKQPPGNYAAEVLALRNFLAHGRPEVRDDGYLFHHYGKQYFFNEEASSALRKTILKYKSAFSNILIALNT